MTASPDTRLLAALRQIARALDQRHAERLEISPGLLIPVAHAGHLLVMKVLAAAPDRPQDAVEVQALLRTLDEADRTRARAAARRVEQLGANRGRSIVAELDDVLSRSE